MRNVPTLTLDWIQAEKAKHRKALADLEAAERVLLGAAATESVATRTAPASTLDRSSALPKGKRKALLAIIAASPNGLSTPETIREAVRLGLADLSTANVSPKLSESRKQGYLELLQGGRWRITDTGREFLASEKN